MTSTRRRLASAGIAGAAVAALLVGAPAQAASTAEGNRNHTTVQLLSFNDYHGHLEATDPPLPADVDPSQTPVGGVEYLSSKLTELRAASGGRSLTVGAGDLIGGSPFLSALFRDEPSVESLNALGLDVSSVGNHEFDEGTAELLRMQRGGCHPVDGCYFPDAPYAGADFPWLAANVVDKQSREPLLRATKIETVGGVKVGFIGVTLKETPTLVSPAGVSTVDFLDEVETANKRAVALKKRGVKAIVLLLHQGGYSSGTYDKCTGISDPVGTMATRFSTDIDVIFTGHTHDPYVCSIPDPAGNPRYVTSAGDYGRMVTETSLVVNRRSGEVDRGRTVARNHLVTRTTKDPAQTAIIDKWKAIAAPLAGRVVGSVSADILGDSSGDRGIETPMADAVADAFLAATDGADEGGAQIAFQNVGGTRASLRYDQVGAGEQPGQITYAEAFAVLPFGNRVVSVEMTGAQIEEALEQQYQPVPARGSRPMLALGVSNGFAYTWDAAQPQGFRVVPGSMSLNGTPMSPTATYRVALPNFLQEGGDLFTAFAGGTNLVGGPEDVPALTAYLGANPGLAPPADRIAGL
ncbi:MAG: bifunctional metallophosphatase/5'-nucleotidase [Dermatophilaceae bacterium]